MILAELEVWHTRPLAPTRRVSLGNLVLPVDPAPGFGGLLLGAVLAGHIGDVPDDLVPDVHRLIDQIDRDERVVQPRLRHRFQVDRHGMALSTHRLVGDGEEITFDFHTTGSGLAQVLGADLRGRAPRPGEPPHHRARPAQGDAVAGRRRAGADRPPRRDQLDGAGHAGRSPGVGDGHPRVPPGQRDAVEEGGHRAVPGKMRGVHPDHGGDQATASTAVFELAEARKILTDSAFAPR